jgi:alcohol dehydrogenase (cytochrome c)
MLKLHCRGRVGLNLAGSSLAVFKSTVFAFMMICVPPATRADESATPIKAAPAFSTRQLSSPPTNNWVTNGGSLYNQRYSPLTAINRDTIKNLKAQWRTHLNGSGIGAQYSGQAQPLFYEGVLYITTGASDVFALELATGRILWSYEAKLDPARIKVCCGWVNRGVGMGDGKIFVGQLDAKLVALDQRTGKVVWSVQAEDPLQGYSIVSAPLYYEGRVITGFGGGDMGVRGRVKSYDAKNGKLQWTFYTIPAPGEPFGETWPQDNEMWKYGGATVWQTPAVDPELGMLYFSTGNAAPDFNGSVRPGDNLFTVSIVALDVKTGKYRWHFQQVHHDIWDYDSPSPVVLFDVTLDGKPRKALAEVSKTGWVYILDRSDGKPLLGIEERAVPQEPRQHTAATQPYPVGDAVVPQSVDIAPDGFPLINEGRIFTPFWDKTVVYKPQMAVNWPPSSYDPQTNIFYVCAIDAIGSSFSDRKPFAPPALQGMWMGGGGAFTGVASRGIFAAVDLKTNRLVWRQQWPERCFSGSLVTAGGLVFTGRSDGRFTALDKADGTKLWQFQTDAGVNATASTFDYQGQQYIAVMSAGTLFGGSKKGDSVWLFSLSGKLESFPIAPPPRPGAPPVQAEVVIAAGTPDIDNGKKLYGQFCVACHGGSGMGGHGGGAPLVNASKDLRMLVTTVTTGRNEMPSFRGVLPPEQIRDVSAYIAEKLF